MVHVKPGDVQAVLRTRLATDAVTGAAVTALDVLGAELYVSPRGIAAQGCPVIDAFVAGIYATSVRRK